MMFNRIFLIVMDGFGIGTEPRSKEFQDDNPNTLKHISERARLNIKTLINLGLASIGEIDGFKSNIKQIGYSARIQEYSNAKDTLAGHWEMMGIKTEIPFPVFTKNGFPSELIDLISKSCDNRKILANKAASGTEILTEFAKQESNDHGLIVYTSADSVLQICGNENVMGLKNLYRYARECRKICSSRSEWNVGRIIARPYIEVNNKFQRTPNRHDLAVKPPQMTILDELVNVGVNTIGIGKIGDIFSMQGIKKSIHSESNDDGMDITIDLATQKIDKSLIFTNLVEFDSSWGHRRDVDGYINGIEALDIKLAKLINAMRLDDLLIITSDHGNDPTAKGTDHTREYLPLLIYNKEFKKPKCLQTLLGLGVVGNIIAKNFGVNIVKNGEDIFSQLI